MNSMAQYDLKLGLFVYNPDQEIKTPARNSLLRTKNWVAAEVGMSEDE